MNKDRPETVPERRDREFLEFIHRYGPTNWGRIITHFGLSWPTARQSLKRLRDAGAIITDREYTTIQTPKRTANDGEQTGDG